MSNLRLKIISDGTAAGTRIVDVATGAVLGNVLMVNWCCAADEPEAHAVIDVWGVELEAQGVLGLTTGEPATAEPVLTTTNKVIDFTTWRGRNE